jgi:hypothetical protein
MTIQERAKAELEARIEGEKRKAIEKYGDQSQEPCGAPEKDIFDYAINELVGLVRYGKMTSNRTQLMQKTGVIHRRLAQRGVYVGEDIASNGYNLALALISFRLELKELGLHLGEPERRR